MEQCRSDNFAGDTHSWGALDVEPGPRCPTLRTALIRTTQRNYSKCLECGVSIHDSEQTLCISGEDVLKVCLLDSVIIFSFWVLFFLGFVRHGLSSYKYLSRNKAWFSNASDPRAVVHTLSMLACLTRLLFLLDPHQASKPIGVHIVSFGRTLQVILGVFDYLSQVSLQS